MKYGLFSIRDHLVGYGYPVISDNDNTARRDFENLVLTPSFDKFRKRPQDYSLYKIGEFDTESGKIDAFDAPVYVSSATDVDISSVKEFYYEPQNV